ncbi:type I toxin-antitoxin system Fst family toxin [Staphylococcus chromogenes]|nr:type I toxin-antitoxin system Fst family toxin [Staphylococcus chromogenes]MDT0680550.1 type I toxin-antitoxin system Fst family toxin [Staphylococcus chromogenes]MDU0481700.1 type I toxin-antitoxin system Fst family toxin [Staphylococcus chromogenes]
MLVHIMSTVISSWIVELISCWLRNHNNMIN